MVFVKKYPKEITIAVLIIFLYLLLRLPFILKLPIFTDEAIYIRWAQYLLTDFKFWDYAVTDGKQPVFIWLITLLMHFIAEPLLAGRLASLISGLITLFGLYLLASEIFRNKWIGIISSFLYATYPFALVYDRMALYDSLVGSFAVWGLYFVVLLARHVKLKYALILGVIGGLGALNKSNGFFTIILLPFSVVLLDFKKIFLKNKFFHWFIYSVIAGLVTYSIYSLLRLSPYFHIIEQKNAIFVYPLNEWIRHPFTYFWSNLWIGQRDWFVRYFTYPYIVLVMISFLINKNYIKEKTVLIVWFIIPFLMLALFGKTLYPRYIFFMTLSLIPVVAYSLYNLAIKINNQTVSAIIIGSLLVVPLWKDYLILFDFGQATIPISDVSQYYTDWPSGYGLKDTIDYLKNNEKGKIALYTQGTFGLLPDAYLIYLHDNPMYQIEGIWPVPDHIPGKLLESAEKLPTYIVFFQPCSNCPAKGKAPPGWPLDIALQVKKPAVDAWFTLYKVRTK